MLAGDMGIVSGFIASGLSGSIVCELYGCSKVGLILPTLTSTKVSFEVSPVSGGTYRSVNNLSGLLSLEVGVGAMAIACPELAEALAPWRYVKVIVVAQTDGRYFHFVLKK